MSDNYKNLDGFDSNYKNAKNFDDAVPSVTTLTLSFINQVYGWMSLGLLLTACAAAYIFQSGIVTGENFTYIFYPAMIIEILLVIGINSMTEKLSPALAGFLFLLYAVINGITLSVLGLVYTQASLASTFFITAGTFAAISIFGYTTKRNLNAIGTFCLFALIGIIIATIVNIFMQSETIYWILTYAGILVFAGLTAYDTQKVREMSEGFQNDGSSRTARRLAVNAALALYLDFINLFIYLLRIFGRRN